MAVGVDVDGYIIGATIHAIPRLPINGTVYLIGIVYPVDGTYS